MSDHKDVVETAQLESWFSSDNELSWEDYTNPVDILDLIEEKFLFEEILTPKEFSLIYCTDEGKFANRYWRRIKEIRDPRNPIADMAKILDVDFESISAEISEITNTSVGLLKRCSWGDYFVFTPRISENEKKFENSSRLNEIVCKNRRFNKLDIEDIKFLYALDFERPELDRNPEVVGLLACRSHCNDVAEILECDESQIVEDFEKIDKSTIAYVNVFSEGVVNYYHKEDNENFENEIRINSILEKGELTVEDLRYLYYEDPDFIHYSFEDKVLELKHNRNLVEDIANIEEYSPKQVVLGVREITKKTLLLLKYGLKPESHQFWLPDFYKRNDLNGDYFDDMAKVNDIYSLFERGADLRDKDLRFLYGLDRNIKYIFAETKERITSILYRRNPREDLSRLLNMDAEKIGYYSKYDPAYEGFEVYCNSMGSYSSVNKGYGSELLPKLFIGDISFGGLKKDSTLKFRNEWEVRGAVFVDFWSNGKDFEFLKGVIISDHIGIGGLRKTENLILHPKTEASISAPVLYEADNIILQKGICNWNVDFGYLHSAGYISLPKKVLNDVRFNLLEVFDDMDLSEVIGGDFEMGYIKNLNELILHEIRGNANLGSLEKAKKLIFNKKVGKDIQLERLQDIEILEILDGAENIYLNRIESLEGVTIKGEVPGKIYLNKKFKGTNHKLLKYNIEYV